MFDCPLSTRRLCMIDACVVQGGCGTADSSRGSAIAFALVGSTWYEEGTRYYEVAPTGRQALYGSGPTARLIVVTASREDSTGWRHALEMVRSAVFDHRR